MLRPKKGFENSEVSFRVNSSTLTLKVNDITPELIERLKHHVDLSYYVEEYEPIKEYIPELHDPETIIQEAINKPKKTRSKKKL